MIGQSRVIFDWVGASSGVTMLSEFFEDLADVFISTDEDTTVRLPCRDCGAWDG